MIKKIIFFMFTALFLVNVQVKGLDLVLENTISCGNKTPYVVAFSPDGTKIASGVGGEVKIFEAETGKLLSSLDVDEYAVGSIAFSRDGKKIVAGSAGGVVKVFDVKTGKSLGKVKIDEGLNTVFFNRDAKKVFIENIISGIECWTIGEEKAKLFFESGRLISEGKTLFGIVVSGRAFSSYYKIMDIEDDRLVNLAGRAFSSYYKIMDINDSRSVRLAKVAIVGRKRLETADIMRFCFKALLSPDGKYLATQEDFFSRGLILEVDSFCGRSCCKGQKFGKKHLCSFIFSPDSRMLASGQRDGSIKLWDVKTGDCLALCGDHCEQEGHKGYVVSVAFGPDGKELVSCSHDKTIKVWKIVGDEDEGVFRLSLENARFFGFIVPDSKQEYGVFPTGKKPGKDPRNQFSNKK